MWTHRSRVNLFEEDIVCKVLIADDSPIMRRAIRRTLEEQSFIEIAGEASNFVGMMQMVMDLRPDVLLFDLHLPQ